MRLQSYTSEHLGRICWATCVYLLKFKYLSSPLLQRHELLLFSPYSILGSLYIIFRTIVRVFELMQGIYLVDEEEFRYIHCIAHMSTYRWAEVRTCLCLVYSVPSIFLPVSSDYCVNILEKIVRTFPLPLFQVITTLEIQCIYSFLKILFKELRVWSNWGR